MAHLVKSFKALRPQPKMADDVIAPPYDVINSKEASELAKDRPNSFLHISKPEIDLEDGIAYNDPEVYEKGKQNLDQMIENGVLIEDSKDMLYLYEMIDNDIHQLGIAAVGSVDAYEKELIKRHEFTKPDKELDRVKNISSNYFITFRLSDTTSHNYVHFWSFSRPKPSLTIAPEFG